MSRARTFDVRVCTPSSFPSSSSSSSSATTTPSTKRWVQQPPPRCWLTLAAVVASLFFFFFCFPFPPFSSERVASFSSLSVRIDDGSRHPAWLLSSPSPPPLPRLSRFWSMCPVTSWIETGGLRLRDVRRKYSGCISLCATLIRKMNDLVSGMRARVCVRMRQVVRKTIHGT